ncbi:LOW QUALITY PROTEIN: titin [Daphnia magna]|uniref:LOW QUALITY PROTEIN: titin n=1 Tax=Daphnia magna TaxID=35525 RepID=UPI001E1BB187|nr:LOW QUALITY PROTEIN: titin [Daphnia magna]
MADLSVKLPKPKYGQVVVLQKNGDEPRGHGFPLISTSCVVGRSTAADIRISSADVSLTHCIFMIDESSGEASLEVRGNETQVNGTIVDPVNTIKLNHKDVVVIGGRKLRFEYLPPDYKPLPSKPIPGVPSDSFNAEVVDLEENGDVVDSNAEKEEEVLQEVLSTPAAKRVSFGPYLSPEQFDNTLPPATPIKKGATPRRSTRYSGLKFTRSMIDPLVEEDVTLESPSKEQPVINSKDCIDETIISEDDADASVSSLAPASETAIVDSSPSLGIGVEFPELSNSTNLEMSVDAMSTLSDVSNIAAVPSECCSFLDEPIEEDEFGPEVVEQEEESLSQMEDTSLFSEDIIGVGIPASAMTTSRLTNGTELLRSFTTSSLAENMGDEDEEEGITLSPEDMSAVKNGHGSIIDSTTVLEVETQETPVPVKMKEIPSSPQVDDSDVGQVEHLVETQKLIPVTPKADSASVGDAKQLSQIPEASTEGFAKVVETTAAVVVERVEQVDIININADLEKVMETPECSPGKASLQTASPVSETPKLEREKETDKTVKTQVYQTPKADGAITKARDTLAETPKALPASPKLDITDLEGVARLLETPKSSRSTATAAAIGKTPQADYTDVRGVKKLLQTPKPPPNTPKADYRDVRGVKRLLATPKAAPSTPVADYTDVEGVNLLMKTPKAAGALPQTDEEKNKMEVSEESPGKLVIAEESKPEGPLEVPETTKKNADETKDIKETASGDKEVQPEKAASDVKESSSPDKPVEIPSEDKPEESVKLQDKSEPTVEEELTTASNRGRRAPSTKADYGGVSGFKRVLRIPRVPGTPKADYSNVEGIDLLMKTPKSKEVPPQSSEDKKHETVSEQAAENAAMESSSETSLKSVESMKEIKEDASQSDEKDAVPEVEEQETKEAEGEKEAPLPRRGRRAATPKTPSTPKADYRDVSGVKRLLKTPKADYSDVEGVDLLMKTPKPKDPVSQTIEEEKPEAIPEAVPEKVEESTAESSQESSETKETIGESSEESTTVDSHVSQVQLPIEDETQVEKETTLPRRGRRPATAAAAKTNTPKADYREVSGVKRLLRTPKAALATPKADYSDVEGIDLLMKTPKVSDEIVEAVREESTDIIESTPGSSVEAPETTELVEKEDAVVSAQVKEPQPTQEEETEEVDAKKEVAAPRRGRKPAAAAKTNTPKADYRDVKGVKRLLKTPTAATSTPQADDSDVEDVDVLRKTPQAGDPEPEKAEEVNVPEGSSEKPAEEATAEANQSNEEEAKREEAKREENAVYEPRLNVEEEAEVEKEATPPRRGRRAAPKSNTPKPGGRAKRKQPLSDSDSQPESIGTADAPSASEKEEQIDEEKADCPVKSAAKISTPKRSRRVPSTKVETPKAVRSTRGKRPSESDSGQSEEVESRPLRSKRRKEEQLSEKLTLSPVVRLQRIDIAAEGTPSSERVAKVTRKRGSVSSGEEWGVPEQVKPIRRGRGRPPKVVAHKTVEEEKAEEEPLRTATHKGKAAAVEEPISSDEELEDVEVKSTKKTTVGLRRGAVKRTSVPEKEEIAPEGKRRRGETRASKHVTGLDDVEMLHEGKGHAADIHANHMPDEVETNEESPVTCVKSGRSTRAKSALKVHFDVAETAPSPVRSTRSARKTTVATATPADKKVSVQLERDPDIETLAATAQEEEDKAPATKRSRHKKGLKASVTTMADESPAVPATIKRTRGGKKTTSEPELHQQDTSAPPSPRRTRRTRNI